MRNKRGRFLISINSSAKQRREEEWPKVKEQWKFGTSFLTHQESVAESQALLDDQFNRFNFGLDTSPRRERREHCAPNDIRGLPSKGKLPQSKSFCMIEQGKKKNYQKPAVTPYRP